MKKIKLSGSVRQNVGKAESAELRAEGKIPCVLYGGDSQIHFWAHGFYFRDIIYTPETSIIQVEVEGKSYDTVVQEVQFHPVSDALLHVDFLQLFEDKPIKLSMPIKYTGNSAGVKAGGKFVPRLKRLNVRALPKDLPEFLEVDITHLEMGKAIKVREISFPNVTILEAAANPICTVTVPRGMRGQQAADKK